MTKYLAAVIAALLLALAGMGVLYRSEVKRVGILQTELKVASEALSASVAQRKKDSGTLAARSKANAATGLKTRIARAATETALAAVPAWSEADVPAGVAEALLRDSGGSENDAR